MRGPIVPLGLRQLWTNSASDLRSGDSPSRCIAALLLLRACPMPAWTLLRHQTPNTMLQSHTQADRHLIVDA